MSPGLNSFNAGLCRGCTAVSIPWGDPVCGCPPTLFGVYIRAPDFSNSHIDPDGGAARLNLKGQDHGSVRETIPHVRLLD